MNRDIDILVSHKVPIPITGGWLQSKIILPETCSSWNEDEQRIFLSHELIHVSRFDALRHLLGRLAISVYWFHPLAWLAAKMSVLSREQACDEAVLDMGVKSSTYAKYLMKVADKVTLRHSQLSLGAVQKSQLERRVISILNRNKNMKYSFLHTCLLVALSGFGLALTFVNPVEQESSLIGGNEAPFEVNHVSQQDDDKMTIVIFDGSLNQEELTRIQKSLLENEQIKVEYDFLGFRRGKLNHFFAKIISPYEQNTLVSLEEKNLGKDGKAIGFTFNHWTKELQVMDMTEFAKEEERRYYHRKLAHYEMKGSPDDLPERPVVYLSDVHVNHLRNVSPEIVSLVFEHNNTEEHIKIFTSRIRAYGIDFSVLDSEYGPGGMLSMIHYQIKTPNGKIIKHEIRDFYSESKMGFIYRFPTSELITGDLSKSDEELAKLAYQKGILGNIKAIRSIKDLE